MRFTILILAALLVTTGCGKPLPVLGDVPAFHLTDQAGHDFSSAAALDGHVWVADFVYTSCEASCPRMSSQMHTIQTQTGSDIRLVSFSVDPTRDTPAVLAQYAKRYAYDAARWSFLTGDVPTLNRLDQDAFKLGSIGDAIEHSTRFALVDKKGRIRGYYGIAEGDPAERIAKDAARLEKESS